MGTRGTWGITGKGKKVATYVHWDAYPTGLGKEVVEALSLFTNEQIQDCLDKLEIVHEQYTTDKSLIERYSQFTNTNVSEQSSAEWYCLLREAMGFPELWLNGTIEHMEYHEPHSEEWGYQINLDENALEVTGHNSKERFDLDMLRAFVESGEIDDELDSWS